MSRSTPFMELTQNLLILSFLVFMMYVGFSIFNDRADRLRRGEKLEALTIGDVLQGCLGALASNREKQ
uniref:Uncharacterized protein n=1 Tax=Steinernema glaseri TaxID=37863 RepID=A0A1I7ZEB2_9BILA